MGIGTTHGDTHVNRQAGSGAARHPSSFALSALTLALVLVGAACTPGAGDAGPLLPSVAAGSPAAASPAGGSGAPSTSGSTVASGAPSQSPSRAPAPGESAGPPTAASPSPAAPTAAPTTSLVAYFLLGEHLVPVQRTVPKTVAVARAAVQQLLAGPTAAESTGAAGLVSCIPAGSRLLDISITGGIATVDLTGQFESGGGSASMFARLAQVVYTLTQFPSVGGVLFRLDGQPVETFSSEGIVLGGPSTRADYRDWVAPIFVDSPAWGAAVSSPLRVAGLANVFEAQFSVEISTASGTVIAGRSVTASCGTGCWGTYDVTLPYAVSQPQTGWVTVFDLSPRDGSRENVTSYPVTLQP